MKTLAFLLILLIFPFGFPILYQQIPSLSNGQTQIKQSFRKTVINEDSFISQTFNHSSPIIHRSIIKVYNGKNNSVSVVLETQEALTTITVDRSTLIQPPNDLKSKIDPNLLNLTRLVTGEYLCNNQTNVIVSIPPNISLQKDTELITQKSIVESAQKIYTSNQTPHDIQFLATRLAYSDLFELAKTPYINYIWLDRKFEACLDQSVGIIKDPEEWNNIESAFNRQINGSGIKIAILDTGIDSSHPDFYFSNATSKIIATTSFTGEPSADRYGHGTHCASICAGTGAASGGQYVGVAPSAALLNVKVLDNRGQGLESWIISGVQWAVDNGADILSMSFGSFTTSNGTDPLSIIVDWATEQGAVCAVAAGNIGSQMYTISSPGVAKSAITVGASSKTDILASFSSRGPTIDYRIKPDVVAPGVNIVAARANGSTIGTPVSQYYTQASGTSMATPHVAGAAALLLDAHSNWSPTIIKTFLANYAENIGSDVFGQGSGRLDICKSTTASIAANSSVSFGRVHLDDTYNQLIVFRSLANTTSHVTLDAETWSVENKATYDVASLNTSSLDFTSGTSRTVELQLDTSLNLPSGYFEGRITATLGDLSIRIPFFFCIMSQLDVEVTDENGSELMASFILIDLETGKTKTCSERAHARFIIPHGQYVIQALNVYAWYPSGSLNAAISFIIHQKLSIGKDETMHLQLSLASAYKLNVRSTDIAGSPIHLTLKQLITPYYYIADSGVAIDSFATQYLYLTNISEYMVQPCYFGFMGFSRDDIHWTKTGVLTSEVDAYFLGWDISDFGLPPVPTALNYADSELATFDVKSMNPKSATDSTIWFNQVAGMWQSGLWDGFQTYPGMNWKIHTLPYQYRNPSSASWAELEWSCIYALSTYPDESPEYFVIDRHFDPITKGETYEYHMGKTPLLPQNICEDPPYYGSGLYIPYYPLLVQKNLFIAKTDMQATKRVEVMKDGLVIYNQTKSWAQEPIIISQFLNSHGYGLYSFIVKTGTSLDYSSENVAKYVINYTSSNTDFTPPSIVKIDCTPCFTDSQYQLKMHLTDNDKLFNVSLQYLTDNDSWISSPVKDLGEGLYSANLSIPSTVQKISVTLKATDMSGNTMQFSTKPVAERGHKTQIDATLNANGISGNLTVTGGALPQPVYLKVKSNTKIMYTLTDVNGNFAFAVPQSMDFPIEIEMTNMGSLEGSICIIDLSQFHDVSITHLEPSKTIASRNLRINVTAMNQGGYTETFKVTIYANSSSILSQHMTLASQSSATITVTWDTTGFAKGNYTLSAYAEPVPGETDTADNTLVADDEVCVSVLGDLDADFDVDLYDAVKLLVCYGLKKGNPKYDPNCDIDEDGDIDLYDAVLLLTHYGEKRH